MDKYQGGYSDGYNSGKYAGELLAKAELRERLGVVLTILKGMEVVARSAPLPVVTSSVKRRVNLIRKIIEDI